MAMTVKITDDFSINVSHKDGMCDLKEVFEYGNKLRIDAGKSIIEMREWLGRQNTCEFIISHEKITYENLKVGNIPTFAGHRFSASGPLNCLTIGKSRVNKTRADLLLTIKAAAALDTNLEVLIYTIFINQGILDLRDQGGDNFNKLNDAIDEYMPGREDKSSNKGLYINAAKNIRKGLGCESLADWNVQDADSELHAQRAEVESRIISFLENGMVESTKHLWYLIEKQCRLVRGD
jgi:hypothetical protein